MLFINATGNTIKLNDTGKIIPFLAKEPQSIDSDEILRSQMFQMLCVSNKFLIVSAGESRIEQNLLRIQKGEMPLKEDRIEVIIRGHFFSNTGYGKANRNLVYALGRAGVRVGIETSNTSTGTLNQMELEKISRFRRELPNAICIDSMIPSFSENNTEYRYRILNTTIEATTVPVQFVDASNAYDEVWVASDFCKEVLEKHGVNKPIYVIPNAVETKLYNESAKPHCFKPPLKNFVFVAVASWSHRKGLDALLKAYCDEFSKDDDTTLLIVTPYDGEYAGTTFDKINDEIKEYIATFGGWHRAPHIARLGRDIPEHEMPRLYKACHCFVLPSRGEGFGLPYVEASLCGLPIIATDHSGHTMFLKDDNSFLVDIDTLSIMEGGKTGVHYWDGQYFPDLTSVEFISCLGHNMRWVKNCYAEAQEKNKKLQKSLSMYSLESVGQKAAERLKDIWNQLSS